MNKLKLFESILKAALALVAVVKSVFNILGSINTAKT